MNVKTVRNGLAAAAIATGALFATSVMKTPKPADEAVKVETTFDKIKAGADKATDHPAPLGAALALELMGVGAAGAAVKRNRVKAETEVKVKVDAENAAQEKDAKIRDIRAKIASLEDEISDAIVEYRKLDVKRNAYQEKYFAYTKDIISSDIAAKDTKPRYLGYEPPHYDDGIRITDGEDVYESREAVESRCNEALKKKENATVNRNNIENVMQLYEKQMEDLHIREKKYQLEELEASLKELMFK